MLMIRFMGDFKMELWEKKLRNAIRTEIRGLVNEGKLDLAVIAENMQLDVSALLAEADEEAGTVDVVAKDGELHVHVAASASAEGDSETSVDALGDMETDTIGGSEEVEASDAFGDDESEELNEDDAADQVVAERWQHLAGLIRG
jgi:hypothetical protein